MNERPKIRKKCEFTKFKNMSETYRLRLNDVRPDARKCRAIETDIEYDSKEAAAKAAWAIADAIMWIHGLNCETSGREIMVFYQIGKGGEIGALAIEVYDSAGHRVEDTLRFRSRIITNDMKQQTERRTEAALRMLLENFSRNIDDAGQIIEEYESAHSESECAESRQYQALVGCRDSMKRTIDETINRLNK